MGLIIAPVSLQACVPRLNRSQVSVRTALWPYFLCAKHGSSASLRSWRSDRWLRTLQRLVPASEEKGGHVGPVLILVQRQNFVVRVKTISALAVEGLIPVQ